MGRRGPKPKPTNTKRLNGNPGMRPLNQNEPEYRSIHVIDDCPAELVGDARDEWIRMLSIMGNQGIITSGDVAPFVLYCQAYGEYIQAQRAVNDIDCLIVETSATTKPHPMLAIRDKAAMMLLKVAIEFGLTPSSRSRIELPNSGAKDELDDFDNFQSGALKISG